MRKAPAFWSKRNLLSYSLLPAGLAYGAISGLRIKLATPWRASVPVICVGNVSLGGSGKTPVAIAIAKNLHSLGVKVFFISRGYGGWERGPWRVDAARDDAARVGDEPLLLAKVAPCIVARDRAQAAKVAIRDGAQAIIMDDGLQNFTLHKDLSFVVFDSKYGVGNGWVFPAGPLREPVRQGLARSDTVILMGDGDYSPHTHLPVIRASMNLSVENIPSGPIFAFAGIAQPSRFFASLSRAGAQISKIRTFADHAVYSEQELREMLEQSKKLQARLVTTEKDFVRLPEWFAKKVVAIPATARFLDEEAFDKMLKCLFADR